MTLEFFLVLLAVVGFGLAAMWIYAAIFDFVDAWKKKRDRAMLREGRLPPMIPDPWHTAPADRMDPLTERPMSPENRAALDQQFQQGMTTGLYDYDAPTGPPDGHERRPSLPKARRMMD